eukprot:scaffold417060_cov23-Prasinocladus_malaysianus.AAC.1
MSSTSNHTNISENRLSKEHNVLKDLQSKQTDAQRYSRKYQNTQHSPQNNEHLHCHSLIRAREGPRLESTPRCPLKCN